MPAGFESYTDDGRLQFSSDFMSFYFAEKGTRLMNQTGISLINDPKFPDPSNGQLWTYPISYDEFGTVYNQIPNAAGDIILYNCATPLICGHGDFPFACTNVADQTLHWYRFRPFLNRAPTSGVGLQVFNAAGQLTYDSNVRPLLVRQRVNNIVLFSGMNTPLGLPAGRTYAYGCPILSDRVVRSYSTIENPGPTATTQGLSHTHGGDVIISEVDWYSWAASTTSGGVAVIYDVTGF